MLFSFQLTKPFWSRSQKFWDAGTRSEAKNITTPTLEVPHPPKFWRRFATL